MHRYSTVRLAVVLVVILNVLFSISALAQGPADLTAQQQATTNSLPDPPQAKPSSSSGDVWNFDFSPYIWIPGVHGSVGALGRQASIHVSGSDLFSAFDGGLAGAFQARKGRLVMPIDFMWVRLATDKGIPQNEIGQSSVNFKLTQTIFTPKVGYRIIDGEHLKFDALVGIRYWYLGQTLTTRPDNISRNQSANWVDAVGGGKFELYMTPKAWITVGGDVGGGAATLDYQAVGLLNFQPKPLLGLFVGWRYLDVDYQNGNNGFLYDVAQTGPIFGFNMHFGGKPPVPPTASCSASPSEVWAGEPVNATINTQNFNPKHTLTYSWASSAGKVSGTSTTGNVDTAGLAPGTYTVTGTASDSKEKKNGVATCNASFTVKQPHPPQASCSASPDTVKPGESSTVSVSASSPDNVPLTYAWSSTAGSINGNGTSATLNTAGAVEGPITATATVTDSRGLNTTCNATVNVAAPPVPTPPQASQIGECQFTDAKRPARVDNACKAVLDDAALRIQHESNGMFIVVGNSENQAAQLGAQRAVNVKYYLTQGEGKSGIDASRIEPRTGTANTNTATIYFVPSGATFTEQTTPVDEAQVKGQARNAPARRTRTKKPAGAQTPPAQ